MFLVATHGSSSEWPDEPETTPRVVKPIRGLDVGTATDILWTLNHPTVWHLLVRERGWTAEQYERWLGDAFCSQLLRARNDA